MRALSDCLNHSSARADKTLSALVQQHTRAHNIEKALGEESRLPHGHYRVGNLRYDSEGHCQLLLWADHPTTSMRIRQLEPSLLARLRSWDISKITIKINPDFYSRDDQVFRQKIPQRTLTQPISQMLTTIAPQTKLGKVFQHMVANAQILR